mgnify:CR=1 FL=1
MVKSGYKLKEKDVITFDIKEKSESKLEPENIDLDIIFEDECLLVMNKPAGMVVHPGAGNYKGTLVNALLHHSNHLSSINGEFRPGMQP